MTRDAKGRGLREYLFTGWRRWALAVAALVAVLLVVDILAGHDIRVRWILRDLENEGSDAAKELRKLDRPYRPALLRAYRSGGRPFGQQRALALILLGDPYYAWDEVKASLTDDDTVVRRAAAAALLRRSVKTPPGPVPDSVLEVLTDWAKEPGNPWLGTAIADLAMYDDPRVVPFLLEVVRNKPSGELADIARGNQNRKMAADRLAPYVDRPEVAEVLREVANREDEDDFVQAHVLKTLAAGGYAEDVDLYWRAARSKNAVIRQMVADNLEQVNDPRVVPILRELLEDPGDEVRRGALASLIHKKDPSVMEELYYLAEDSYANIKGDLAEAVGIYRREDRIPFVAWCLLEYEPNAVRKAVVELVRMTGKHYGFDAEQWDRYKRSSLLDRVKMIEEFMNDEGRKEAALAKWAEDYPPRYTDRDRIPYLIRQLGHKDLDNVQRAIRELARITGRTEGLPAAVIDTGASEQERADALWKFMKEDRERVIPEWKAWLATQK